MVPEQDRGRQATIQTGMSVSMVESRRLQSGEFADYQDAMTRKRIDKSRTRSYKA